jgi:TorA maturation chaperone TorD
MANAIPAAARTLTSLSEEDLRAALYRLIAATLSAPPSSELLDAIADFEGGPSRLGEALATCAQAARSTDVESEDDAYHELFIGIGSGVLVPFGSYYLTGFLNEKPLAKLREDMASLGIERDPKVREPEDHIASVLEIMAGLIAGHFGRSGSLDEQKTFFNAHVATWAPDLFKDLSGTRQSAFYAAIGALGSVFMDIEIQAFEYV